MASRYGKAIKRKNAQGKTTLVMATGEKNWAIEWGLERSHGSQNKFGNDRVGE